MNYCVNYILHYTLHCTHSLQHGSIKISVLPDDSHHGYGEVDSAAFCSPLRLALVD